MATINFSIPDDVKREFQRTFAGENRSAIVAALLRRAVEERRQQRRREAAIDSLLELRREVAPASDREIRRARESGRP
jgi:metal-responsive CopG/Arc/MetJ family transcriptional regulator